MDYSNWKPAHDGKCDCGCGEHSVWTIVKLDAGQRRWFLTTEHLARWEADREVQKQRLLTAFPFLADPCYPWAVPEERQDADNSVAGGG